MPWLYLKGISNGEIGEALGQEAKEIAAGVARGVAGFEGTWDERAEVCGWRRLRGFKQLGKVIEGIQFKDGIETKQFDYQVAT